MRAINLSQNKFGFERELPLVEEYDDEVMCAGWNPQLQLLGENPTEHVHMRVNLTPDVTNVDLDAFLKKMYEYQC